MVFLTSGFLNRSDESDYFTRESMTQQKIGLALGGGGARGLAHFGVMQYLEEQGVQVSCIAGTSMGAIVGAAIAAGQWRPLAEGYARLDWMQLLPMVDITLSGSGLLDGQKALEFLRAHIPVSAIEALQLPYAAVATNLTRRDRAVFTRGDLFHAMRASFAIPGIFTPVMTDMGEVLVDGGLVELVPVRTATALGAEAVIAVEVNNMLNSPQPPARDDDTPLIEQLHAQLKSFDPLRETEWGQQILHWFEEKIEEEYRKPPGLFEVMRDSIDFMQAEVVRMQLAQSPPHALITPDTHRFSIWDYHRAEEIIACGYEAARQQLDITSFLQR